MSFLACHVMKFTQVDLRGVSIHNNRESTNSSNKDIDYSRTELNFDALTGENGNPHTNYRAEVEKRLKANYKGSKAIRKDAVRLVSVIVTSDNDFFKNMNKPEIELFFKTAAEHLSERYGPQNTVAAKVHMDETTPHMHFTFVPLTADGRLSAKEITSRSNLRSLQEDLPKILQAAGFNIQRGIENSPNRHKTKQQYIHESAVKEAEQSQSLQEPVSDMPAAKINMSEAINLLNDYIKTLSDEESTAFKKAEYIGKLIPTSNKILLKAQAEFTNGETTKIIAESEQIKNEEKQYNEKYAEWQQSKPSGFNIFSKQEHNKKGISLEEWKTDIARKKAAIQAKIDSINKKLHEPESQKAIKAYTEVLEEQSAYLKERQQNYLEYSKSLNLRIQACQPIRNKLKAEMYTTSTLTVSGETYENLRKGCIEKAKDIITELHNKTDGLRKINLQKTTKKLHNKNRSNDGWER